MDAPGPGLPPDARGQAVRIVLPPLLAALEADPVGHGDHVFSARVGRGLPDQLSARHDMTTPASTARITSTRTACPTWRAGAQPRRIRMDRWRRARFREIRRGLPRFSFSL